MFTSALGCLGAVLSIALPWPQVWRCWAGGRTTGLSASACWLGVAMPIGWIAYGLLLGEHIQIVTNIVTGGAGTAILAALLLSRRDLRGGRKLLATAAGAAAVVAAVALSALVAALPGYDGTDVAPVLGGLLAATATVAAVPQPMSLLRDRTQDLSGLSPLRWQLAAGACASWFGYGLATGQVAVWASASAGLLSALIVCAVLILRKAPAAPASVAAASVAAASASAAPGLVVAAPVSAAPVQLASASAAPALVAPMAVPSRAGVVRGVACAPSRGPVRAHAGGGPKAVRGPVRGGPKAVRGPVRVHAAGGPKAVRAPVRPTRTAATRASANTQTMILRDQVAA